MKLSEWIDKQVARSGSSRTAVHIELSDKVYRAGAPISIRTIASVDRGQRLSRYPLALALSKATMGWVTVEDLCE